MLVIGPGAARVGGEIGAVDVLLEESGAAPHVAARLAGVALDPSDLAQRIRAAEVAALPFGLLAPVTERASVRDVALDAGAPLVVCATPGGGFVDHVRLTLEAARGAGLHVAAVVLAPWPAPPDRAQLEDRVLLEALAGVPVEIHPSPKPWDVDAWRAGAAAASAGPGGAAHVVLEPYTAWQERAVADPRAAGRPSIMAALAEIVAAEGPVLADRAYGLYNRASGGKKLTTIARAPLSGAAYWLVTEHKLVMDGDVLRLPDTPAVRVRELGPRTLDEVPLTEIAELMRRLAVNDPDALKRAVLDAYGLTRLTAKADEYLGEAADLLTRPADATVEE